MRRLVWASITLSMLFLLACGGDDGTMPAGTNATQPPSTLADATNTPAPTATPAATATPEPFTIVPGDSIRIPKIGVDVQMELLVVSPEGRMPDPEDDTRAGIYDFSQVSPGLGGPYGGQPGSGNTIVYAHYARQDGPRAFLNLPTLVAGDEIEISLAGQSYRYTTVIACNTTATQFDIIVARTEVETLTLLTQAESSSRILVIAERTPNSLPRACPSGNPI